MEKQARLKGKQIGLFVAGALVVAVKSGIKNKGGKKSLGSADGTPCCCGRGEVLVREAKQQSNSSGRRSFMLRLSWVYAIPVAVMYQLDGPLQCVGSVYRWGSACEERD